MTTKTAGWWAIAPGEPGLHWPPLSTGLYLGDSPADIMDQAIKDIIREYETAWGRKPYMVELQAVWDFCAHKGLTEPGGSSGQMALQDAVQRVASRFLRQVLQDRRAPSASPRRS